MTAEKRQSLAKRRAARGSGRNRHDRQGPPHPSRPHLLARTPTSPSSSLHAYFYTKVWPRMRPHVTGHTCLADTTLPGRPRGNASSRSTSGPASARSSPGGAEKGQRGLSPGCLAGLIALVQGGALEVHAGGREGRDREAPTGWCSISIRTPAPTQRRGRARTEFQASPARQAPELRQGDRRQGPARGGADHAGAVGRGQDFRPCARRRHGRGRARPLHRQPDQAPAQPPDLHRLSAQQPRGDRGAPYSTRARAGAPVATPLAWSSSARSSGQPIHRAQLRGSLARLRKDPWANIGRVKQTLPTFK